MPNAPILHNLYVILSNYKSLKTPDIFASRLTRGKIEFISKCKTQSQKSMYFTLKEVTNGWSKMDGPTGIYVASVVAIAMATDAILVSQRRKINIGMPAWGAPLSNRRTSSG